MNFDRIHPTLNSSHLSPSYRHQPSYLLNYECFLLLLLLLFFFFIIIFLFFTYLVQSVLPKWTLPWWMLGLPGTKSVKKPDCLFFSNYPMLMAPPLVVEFHAHLSRDFIWLECAQFLCLLSSISVSLNVLLKLCNTSGCHNLFSPPPPEIYKPWDKECDI